MTFARGCFGYHVTSFYAPASRSGTPEEGDLHPVRRRSRRKKSVLVWKELKYLIDTAHGLGIQASFFFWMWQEHTTNRNDRERMRKTAFPKKGN